MPTISSTDFSSNNARSNFPSPHPRSSTRFAPDERTTAITAPIRCCHRASVLLFFLPPASSLLLSHLDQGYLLLQIWPMLHGPSVFGTANSVLQSLPCAD